MYDIFVKINTSFLLLEVFSLLSAENVKYVILFAGVDLFNSFLGMEPY